MIRFSASSEIEDFKARLANARTALSDNTPAMKQVASFLDQWVQRNFTSGGGNVGGWAPYKYGGRLTSKKKANAISVDGHHYVNSNAKLEMDSGRLRLSYLPFASPGNAGIGSDLPYAQWQNDGTEDGTLPQRRQVPVQSEVAADVTEILTGWMLVSLRKMIHD